LLSKHKENLQHLSSKQTGMTALLNQDITLKTSELISSWHGVYHTTVCLWSRFSLMMEMTITKLIQVIN